MTISTRYDFALNREATPQVRHLGSEREPLVQIDDALVHPEALIDFAAREASFAPAEAGGYPGIRAPAPLDYVEAVVRTVDPLLRETFALGAVKLGRAECVLSLVTLPPTALVPAQRVPHVDTVDPLQFAFLHYLCAAEFGGTAFYRHRATGYETLTGTRLAPYAAARADEAAPADAYISGDTAHFACIGSVEARMNRLALYRSRLLHSGQIAPQAPLSADPRTGRLTANIFLSYRPA